MEYNFPDDESFKDVPLLKIEENGNGLPFFIRKYVEIETIEQLHRNGYMQINYIFRGKGKHQINGREFDIVKGDIFVIPPYVPHCIYALPDCGIEVFEFEFVPEFISEGPNSVKSAESFFDFAYIEPFLVCENQVKPRLNINENIRSDVENIFNEALTEYSERKPSFNLMIKSLLLKLLVLVGREFSADLEGSGSTTVFGRHRQAILDAVRYIGENSSEDLNADKVARKFLLSTSYFRYLLKNITYRTFTEYLNDVRVSKAMVLLKSTDKKVLDISMETGFNNVSTFNRIFRQQNGLSPLQFRKNKISKS